MSVQVDLNASKCLVSKSAWGEDVVTNVCTGVVERVEWQAGDYAGAIAVIGFIAVFLFILSAVGAMFWRMLTDRTF